MVHFKVGALPKRDSCVIQIEDDEGNILQNFYPSVEQAKLLAKDLSLAYSILIGETP